MRFHKLALMTASLIASFAIIGCGGSGDGGGSTATQYTLDAEADLTITPVAVAQVVTKIPEQHQVMIGTTLVEVTSNQAEELGVNFLDFDLRTEPADTVDFQFILAPTVTSSGVVFKICPLGNPYGTSYFDLNLAVRAISTGVTLEASGDNVLSDDGETLVLGGTLRAEAEAGDRSRIPVLSDIPVISFLFQGERHQAQLDNLVIILTPQILADTET